MTRKTVSNETLWKKREAANLHGVGSKHGRRSRGERY